MDLRIERLRDRIALSPRNSKRNRERLAEALWEREQENPGAYQAEPGKLQMEDPPIQ